MTLQSGRDGEMVSRGGDSSQKRDCCAQKVNQRAACFRLERRG